MRIPIAIILGAAVVLAPAPAAAQAYNETTNAADPAAPAPDADANLTAAVPPADDGLAVDAAPVADDMAVANDPLAAPAATKPPQKMPWGLLGLLGLVGLLGRRRADRG